MFYTGAMIKHTQGSQEKNYGQQSMQQSLNSNLYNLNNQDEDTMYSNMRGKQNPSEINAESLIIIPAGHPNRRVEATPEAGTLLMKIYYKKRQFIWEYTDKSSLEDRRKKKYEVKFTDIVNMSIKARANDFGEIIIDTNRPIAQFDQKSGQQSKSTQWDKKEDFLHSQTSGDDRFKIVTRFGKDVLTKKPAGKQSVLSKILQCDQRIHRMIESNHETHIEKVEDDDMYQEEGTEDQANFSGYSNPKYIISKPAELPGVNQDYVNELSAKTYEQLVEDSINILKPKKLQSTNYRKYKNKCPACYKSCNTDSSFRDHMNSFHKNILKMGLELSGGNFKANKLFMINVLSYAKAHPTRVKKLVQSISNSDLE